MLRLGQQLSSYLCFYLCCYLPIYLATSPFFLLLGTISSPSLPSKGPLSVSEKQRRKDHKARLNSLFSHKNSRAGPASRLRVTQLVLWKQTSGVSWVEATSAFPKPRVPGTFSSPCPSCPSLQSWRGTASLLEEARGQLGFTGSVQNHLKVTPPDPRSTLVSLDQGPYSAELTIHSRRVKAMAETMPFSICLCSGCFFFLDFISSWTPSFVCLQDFFSPSDLTLRLWRKSQRHSPSTGKHRSVCVSKWMHSHFHFFKQHHPFHDPLSLSSTLMSQADPETPFRLLKMELLAFLEKSR